MLFSLHAHEGRWKDSEQPADFIEEFSRAAIDAGANTVIGHGHHAMRGIEIRDGSPIIYSLGNFIFQNQTVQKMPADFYERYKLDPYSGTPADAYDAMAKAPPRPGYPEHKWFAYDEKYWISIIPYLEFEGKGSRSWSCTPSSSARRSPGARRAGPCSQRGSLPTRS